ncbi:fumarylacetoacetate hydrolase family protein [Streptomyces caniscabiei]|uniref:Fumarylacetoacetate hydrolase family protein n=1 Tax=Streptomyces caniscabiei TaxID=2746961 RepID=A0ABU4N413_9ACTN|nr:fumarylacetoacetate hydrolase family protein [Streptomyces caniscabiei]MDX2948418.1 fumarylacetoacetate hydrolase family protein [Streptomyces caniscabiei]MDX2957676.1 fumarylacetoacetate hydrolase family protein [Streptomyces caniscabiei]MDX2989049.1 fumarylacetoacetate hydrolase family protein [Streptomyces caniscabiei]MDX3015716.1 fumarylacetoacetate hydrolase family protein [Streptomyces caniscabiei]MDX3044213.1 fumarylacetoacetate hydrolase family protein [Streptomyces caniscabiei]
MSRHGADGPSRLTKGCAAFTPAARACAGIRPWPTVRRVTAGRHLGPWLATTDEIDDVLALGMWLDVNGVRRQTSNTKTMIFDPYFIVHYLSQFLVLEPGDLINTGTPPGVGMG